ncbi:hypothetical protein ABNF97_17535 [Plantactinospora sp. B6F1]|uniref:hypothetical protein n=1 Tax=Plantactinospora sp. B6F1 TaxID=3158971 RepID=UPI0032D8ED12
MMQVHIAHEFAVRLPDGSRLPTEELHREGERLMDALLDLEACNSDIGDVATSSEADRGAVVVELVIAADDEATAISKSMAVIRSAIHAIEGCTANWGQGPAARADYHSKGVQAARV